MNIKKLSTFSEAYQYSVFTCQISLKSKLQFSTRLYVPNLRYGDNLFHYVKMLEVLYEWGLCISGSEHNMKLTFSMLTCMTHINYIGLLYRHIFIILNTHYCKINCAISSKKLHPVFQIRTFPSTKKAKQNKKMTKN